MPRGKKNSLVQRRWKIMMLVFFYYYFTSPLGNNTGNVGETLCQHSITITTMLEYVAKSRAKKPCSSFLYSHSAARGKDDPLLV